jgi:pimeloyl-ACP methyl ester carboxylesterase
VAIVGWSWGSITTARYAIGAGAGKVARLVLYAPIFAERNPDWLEMLADPADPFPMGGWSIAFVACPAMYHQSGRATRLGCQGTVQRQATIGKAEAYLGRYRDTVTHGLMDRGYCREHP